MKAADFGLRIGGAAGTAAGAGREQAEGWDPVFLASLLLSGHPSARRGGDATEGEDTESPPVTPGLLRAAKRCQPGPGKDEEHQEEQGMSPELWAHLLVPSQAGPCRGLGWDTGELL